MSKLFLTNIPTREELQQHSNLLYPDLDHLTMYSHILLRRLTTDVEIKLDQFFSQFNLSSGRYTLMVLLHKIPEGLMPSEIAQKVGVTQATISGLINSLEKAELVKRTTHEKDGRSFVIILTDKGRDLMDKILPVYHEKISHFWSEFDETEKHQLNSLMERMVKKFGTMS